MKLKDRQKETPFSARDNMLDIWTHITELSFRGFGKKKRKLPNEPRNFSEWSEESREKWMIRMKEQVERQEYYDSLFIARETEVLDDMCRKIVFAIDGANELRPQYLFEYYKMRNMQDDAITQCLNLKRELNHVMDSIPSNKNFIAVIENDIEKELSLLRGWRKSGNEIRQKLLAKEKK
ncbi:MAG: hypothetical protein IJ820_03110 [Lachnospiraceae bacterium]|nr:hypothetical protein [Lachnospiraceae bacterium]